MKLRLMVLVSALLPAGAASAQHVAELDAANNNVANTS